MAVEGAFAAWWRRTTRYAEVLIEVVLGALLTSRQRKALTEEANRLGDHLGLTAILKVRGP